MHGLERFKTFPFDLVFISTFLLISFFLSCFFFQYWFAPRIFTQQSASAVSSKVRIKTSDTNDTRTQAIFFLKTGTGIWTTNHTLAHACSHAHSSMIPCTACLEAWRRCKWSRIMSVTDYYTCESIRQNVSVAALHCTHDVLRQHIHPWIEVKKWKQTHSAATKAITTKMTTKRFKGHKTRHLARKFMWTTADQI